MASDARGVGEEQEYERRGTRNETVREEGKDSEKGEGRRDQRWKDAEERGIVLGGERMLT